MLKILKSQDVEKQTDRIFENRNEEFFTSKEAANYLRTSPKQIRNWVYEGKLRHYKLLSRKLLFRKEDLDALLKPRGGL